MVIVLLSLAVIGVMLVGMSWWSGDGMGMMGRGSGVADQTPVVTDANQVAVEMRDFEFFPAQLTVDVGTEVTWVNRGNVPHNAVAEDGTFDTGLQQRDTTWSTVLDRPGTYFYVCTFHPFMEGTVTVR